MDNSKKQKAALRQNGLRQVALRRVTPAHPAAPYVGGKRHLAKTLVARIEAIPHKLYAEPFVGMGGVFLRRTQAPKVEVINDISKDVVTLFRILQRHYPAFMDELKFKFTSRAEFERLNAMAAETLTDLERAARFLYLQRTCFGGKVAGRSFGVSRTISGRFDILKLSDVLSVLNERLAGVVIESLPWDRFLEIYDDTETLFYLDPPYFGTEHFYGKDLFPRAEFERLAQRLGALKGRFILSINDTPETRKIFQQFRMEGVDVTYSVNGPKPKLAGELIVSS